MTTRKPTKPPTATAPRPLSLRSEQAGAELDALSRLGCPAPCQIPGQWDWWTSEDVEALKLAAELCREHCPPGSGYVQGVRRPGGSLGGTAPRARAATGRQAITERFDYIAVPTLGAEEEGSASSGLAS